MIGTRSWWRESVLYQVYVRSFYDSNGDGFGDLPGVLAKLDHIQQLGANLIWLNPVYDSPDRDNGYDIADYETIMPRMGTMADWELLLEEVHRRGMKLIMDLVVNHTSEQHPWFAASRSSRNDPKRDWYIWRDPAPDGGPPNNWRSYFESSCWTFDDRTGQYYFHGFAKEQPDLNWENPDLREAIYEMMRRWLARGIDGFRMDAICVMAKQPGFPDADDPYDLSYLGGQPRLHDYLKEINENVLKPYAAFSVGEAAFTGPEEGLLFVDPARNELDTLFHFQVCDDMPVWDLPRYRQIQNDWAAALGDRAVVGQFLNNHDHTRQVTRFGNDSEHRVCSAKLLAMMIHALPGIPCIYQGEEIGMTGLKFDRIDDYQDILTHHLYRQLLSQGQTHEQAMAYVHLRSRDNSRTPMQWNDTVQAGFTTGTPWMTVNPNYPEINVEADQRSDHSIQQFYRDLIRLRKEHLSLVYGIYHDQSGDHPHVYAFRRALEQEELLIVLNPSDHAQVYHVPVEIVERKMRCLLSNVSFPTDVLPIPTVFTLEPHVALLFKMES